MFDQGLLLRLQSRNYNKNLIKHNLSKCSISRIALQLVYDHGLHYSSPLVHLIDWLRVKANTCRESQLPLRLTYLLDGTRHRTCGSTVPFCETRVKSGHPRFKICKIAKTCQAHRVPNACSFLGRGIASRGCFSERVNAGVGGARKRKQGEVRHM